MSDANEVFIRLYEDLVKEVNNVAEEPSSHSFLIERAADRNGLIQKEERRLKYIRDVRHVLQHPRHRSLGSAVVISDTFLEETAELLEYIRKPPTAGDVGVPLKEVRTASLSDCLGDLADTMKSQRFSHLPILDDRYVVIGVFNEAAIFDHLWTESETIIGRGMLVSEVLEHCRLGANHTETFRFVSPRISVDDLVDMFLALQSPTARIGAVFVTASGKDTEPLQRLITPWDVLASSSG